MAYKNKEEQKLAQQKHYQANKPVYIARAKAMKLKSKTRNMKFVNRYKILCGCKRCGYNKYARALEFHHTDSTNKVNAVANMVQKCYSLKLLKTEIRKCDVLCATCHREHHIELGE
jgi:hypothetical protein